MSSQHIAGSRYTGQGVKRKEDKRLLLGRGRYIADLKLPGMLSLVVVRSTQAHAKIRAIRMEKAMKHPGVIAVLTGKDIQGQTNPLPCIDFFPHSKPALHRVLAEDKVRYVGEPIAVIVAKDRYTAEDALELVEVDYEPLPHILDMEEALKPGAPLLFEEFGSNNVTSIHQEVGEVDAAFASAHKTYKETFRIHRYVGFPMETRGVMADCDPAQKRYQVWTANQAPHLVRTLLSIVLGVAPSSIRVVAPDLGGGFGIKIELYPEDVLVPLMSMRLGRPVQWIEDRNEYFHAASHAREQVHEMEAAVSADGTITGVKLKSLTNQGAFLITVSTTPASISSAMLRGPYRIPHYRVDSHCVVTNKVPLAVYRGAGHPQAVLCMERMIEIIARDLGIDSAVLRKQNMLTPEEMPSDRGTEIVMAGKVIYDSGDYPKVLEMALEKAGYSDFRTKQIEARKAGKLLGLGIASFVEETATGPYEAATVRVDGTGKVTLLAGATPMGQGLLTSFMQLVADEFQIDMNDVSVVFGDTDVITDGVGSFASRGGSIGGAAARQAAMKVRKKAMKIAGHLLEVSEDDIEWTGGRAQVKGVPTRGFSLAELAQKATAWNPASALPEGMDFNLDCTHHHQVPGIAFANACHVAVVEIDPETGKIVLKDYVAVHDCGPLINPMIVEGQTVGGVVQGFGGTMSEEILYDAEGRLKTSGMMDYLVPVASDIPFIKTGHLETPSPLNPYGFKGAGEGGLTGAPAALTNAIEDALLPLGIQIRDDGPFTPRRMLELLKR